MAADDLPEPGAEAFGLATIPEVSDGVDQGILAGILGKGDIAGDRQRNGAAPREVASNQFAGCLTAPLSRLSDESAIRGISRHYSIGAGRGESVEVNRPSQHAQPDSSGYCISDLQRSVIREPGPTADVTTVSGFALIVLVLAAIGIYSVMASFVVQRTREIGVRMALGATGPMVHRLVFGQGMLLALIGVATGLALAAASSRVLKGMLYEVTPADPVTFGVVSLTLIAVAALAVLVPSIRAARLEPVEALRAD